MDRWVDEWMDGWMHGKNIHETSVHFEPLTCQVLA